MLAEYKERITSHLPVARELIEASKVMSIVNGLCQHWLAYLSYLLWRFITLTLGHQWHWWIFHFQISLNISLLSDCTMQNAYEPDDRHFTWWKWLSADVTSALSVTQHCKNISCVAKVVRGNVHPPFYALRMCNAAFILLFCTGCFLARKTAPTVIPFFLRYVYYVMLYLLKLCISSVKNCNVDPWEHCNTYLIQCEVVVYSPRIKSICYTVDEKIIENTWSVR